jgi:hypothetical protein
MQQRSYTVLGDCRSILGQISGQALKNCGREIRLPQVREFDSEYECRTIIKFALVGPHLNPFGEDEQLLIRCRSTSRSTSTRGLVPRRTIYYSLWVHFSLYWWINSKANNCAFRICRRSTFHSTGTWGLVPRRTISYSL